MASYPALFSPFKLGKLCLPNRLAHASMTTRFCRDGVLTGEMINYHRNRAEGGAGLIVTEPLALLPRQTIDPRRPSVYTDAGLDALKRLADAIEDADTRLLGQVQEPGRGRHEVGRSGNAIGASALPDDLSWTVPHPMTTGEIEGLINDFAESVQKLQTCGFSGVEISAGHGHVFHQFLSPQANHRDDAYGGDVTGRTRLIAHLIDAIRNLCGHDFIVGLKLPGEDYVPGGIDLGEAAAIARTLARHGGFDYWTFAWGAHANSLHAHLPDAHSERAPYLSKIKQLRAVAREIPCGALGYMTDPGEAEYALTSGIAELAFYGRPLVTDPAFGNKAREGREGEIRYCVSCNTCWRTIVDGNRLECDNNPRVGMAVESDWLPEPVATPKTIAIVGGGIAGLETAWVAAARGHKVTLFCKSDQVGGKTRLHAGLPGGENLSSIYDYQYEAALRHGVRFRLGETANPNAVLDLSPDIVVLATGSRLSVPDFVPMEYWEAGFITDLRSFTANFLQRSRSESGALLIYDKDHTDMTYAAAEFFSGIFARVLIATPRERLGSDISLVNRQGFYERLCKKSVEILTLVEPCFLDELGDAIVRFKNIYSGAATVLEDVVAVTFATPRIPNNELFSALSNKGVEPYLIGDAYAPGSVLAATRAGHRLGLEL